MVRRALPILALWGILAAALSVLTTRVADWFVMTDELLYERLAISIARTHSPLPRVHGVDVHSFAQLYPLLVAPVFGHGYVPQALEHAHFLNAWIMASACIPAFLLARRVTGREWVGYVVGLLAVCMPWIVYASFLLTEVAALPAFLWALLALQRAIASPSARNDVLALAGLALAFVARTQFAVLVVVLPLAILLQRRGIRGHRVLAAAYGVLALGGVVLAAVGRLSSAFGIYGGTVTGRVLPQGFFKSLLEHLATFSLGLGILPFVVGLAWLIANLVRAPASRELHAFASLGSLTVAAVSVEVTIYDLRFGAGFVHDRYLFYLAPVVLLALACALLDGRRPRWSLLAPAALVTAGFALGGQPRLAWPDRFGRLNPDSPVSALYPLADGVVNARTLLALATLVLTALFVTGSRALPRTRLTALVAALLLVGLPVETGYVFNSLLTRDGWASRPLAGTKHFDWIDRTVGRDAHVAIVPYPVSTDYFQSQQLWRDLDFWNVSVDRDVQYPGKGVFQPTGDAFPKLYLRFYPRTGAASSSPARYVAHAGKESRFRIAGVARADTDGVLLIDAGPVWRADWLTFGLYDDGWTRPGVPARVRVFASPGQSRALTRFLTFQIWAPGGVAQRPFELASNLEALKGAATDAGTVVKTIRVCVPAHGFSEVRVRARGASAIPGDMRNLETLSAPRQGGIFLAQIALADETGPPCRA